MSAGISPVVPGRVDGGPVAGGPVAGRIDAGRIGGPVDDGPVDGGPVDGRIDGPQWFGQPGHPLFGWVHPPARPGRGGAVVLCPPLFAEQAVAYATYRLLARDLSAAGSWVVRFDYEGTGDSSGPPDGAGRVAAWLASVDQAVALARACTDGPLALAGMRMGALLAAVAAERRSDVDALVLWDPCRSGRAFVRQHRALQALRFPGTEREGTIEMPGYALDAAMAREVAALRLPAGLHARHALVLTRPGRSQPALHLVGRATASATAAPVMGWTEPGEQEALFEVEHLVRRTPTVTSAQVVHWLGQTLATLIPASARPPGPAGSRDWPVAASTTVEIPAGTAPGATVCERVVRLGDLGLFGIETRAVGTVAADGGPVVVFLSSGSDSHVGPSRLWVRLARQWAAAGAARCIRVDLSGWGESPSHPGQPRQVLRGMEAFDDVLDIAGAVADRRDVVLVGLCSGAYQALESALELRPGAVLAVNPLLRFTPPELVEHGVVSSRRRICEPKQPWIGSVRSRLPRRVVDAAVALRIAFSRMRSSRRVEGWLGELVQSGVHVYCVGGEDEVRPLLQTNARTRASWWSSGHVRIDVVPGLDHALLPMAQREAVCERLTEELHRIGDVLRRGSASTGTGVTTMAELG